MAYISSPRLGRNLTPPVQHRAGDHTSDSGPTAQEFVTAHAHSFYLQLHIRRSSRLSRTSAPSSSLASLHSPLPSPSPRGPRPVRSQRASRRTGMLNRARVFPFESRCGTCAVRRFFPPSRPAVVWAQLTYIVAYLLAKTGATQAVRRRWLPSPLPAAGSRARSTGPGSLTSARPRTTSTGCLTSARPATTSAGHSH